MNVISQDSTMDAASILARVTDAFFALDTEWRFTYLNPRAELLVQRSQEDLCGRNIWEEFPAAVGTNFERQYHHAMAQGQPVAFEEYYPPPLDTWFEVRAYPSPDGLSVFFQNINARKVQEAEMARLVERERNIATQLQDALQPELPEATPGLGLSKYYEAAMAEAGVGGDFWDVFLSRGATVLVVGDLVGKGLAAARQVATVRNMLRAFVYTQPTVAEAVSELNTVLAEQRLITDFATLFVGSYDAEAGTLTYVNCGQEPALARRAGANKWEELSHTSTLEELSHTSTLEELSHTGPVLGAFPGAEFAQETVALKPGDAVAIFTDGLTEVGASRTGMLGVQGVAELLAWDGSPEERASAEVLAEHLALRLIRGVDAFAQGGVMRDDMCLLIAVAE